MNDKILKMLGCIVPLLMGVTLMCGCQAVRAPESYSDMWHSGPVEAPPTDFAARRADGQRLIAQQDPLRLPQLVEIALMRNPSLRQSWQNSRAAEAVVHQAGSKYYPQITASGRLSWQRTDVNATATEIDTTSYGPVAQLSWLLLDYGGRRAERDAALEQLRAANFKFNETFQDLVLDVQKTYFALLAAQAALEAAQSDVEAAEKTLEAAEKKRDAGLGIELDVMQARADSDKALYQNENAKGELHVAAGNLAAAVGLPADMEIKIAQPEQDTPTEPVVQDLRALLDRALAQRPDIAALRATFKSKDAKVRVNRSERWPSLTANASANRYWNSYSASGMADNDTYEYMGYLSLEWKVFDGMLRLQQQRAAEAEREAARYELQVNELSAAADVWKKFHLWQTAQRKMVYSRSYLENARGSYELAKQAYDAGLKNIIDLLKAQSTLASARGELVKTQKELWTALAELANAVGDLQFGAVTADAGMVQ